MSQNFKYFIAAMMDVALSVLLLLFKIVEVLVIILVVAGFLHHFKTLNH